MGERWLVSCVPALAAAVSPLFSAPWPAESAGPLLRGISYGPVPSKTIGEAPPEDDFMVPAFEALWGDSGRGDLKIMRKMGANAVRLYGNDPRFDHSRFLDAANAHGLRVIPGMSNYPFTGQPGACSTTGWDCYEQLKAQYAANLKNGFLRADGSYHPALSHLIIINEPDYKAPGLDHPKDFCKAIISAFDGMLDAEKEAKAKGELVKFTSTFSFGVCSACSKYTTSPALGQMYDLRAAMLQPSSVGYTPKNDLAAAYHDRFVQSFNTPSPANVIADEFLQVYKAEFDEPFFIGEYHAPMVAQAADLQAIMKLAVDNSDHFLGVSFFEFQKAYWKGGSELEFGMLGLGDMPIKKFKAFGEELTAWCLTDDVLDPHQTGSTIAQAVIDAYGGEGVDFSKLCDRRWHRPVTLVLLVSAARGAARQVWLRPRGRSTAQMAKFIKRVVSHLGGTVVDLDSLATFAGRFSGEQHPAAGDFAKLASELGAHPAWVHWDLTSGACVADRTADVDDVGTAVAYACGQLKNCEAVPPHCNSSLWIFADYVFGAFYSTQAGAVGPLDNCSFGGAAAFEPRGAWDRWDGDCVINRDPATTGLTQGGYDAILAAGSDKVSALIRRVLTKRWRERVADANALNRLAANESGALPAAFADLEQLLQSAPWTCGGESHRACPVGGAPLMGAVLIVIMCAAGLSVAAFAWAVCYRHLQKRARARQVQLTVV